MNKIFVSFSFCRVFVLSFVSLFFFFLFMFVFFFDFFFCPCFLPILESFGNYKKYHVHDVRCFVLKLHRLTSDNASWFKSSQKRPHLTKEFSHFLHASIHKSGLYLFFDLDKDKELGYVLFSCDGMRSMEAESLVSGIDQMFTTNKQLPDAPFSIRSRHFSLSFHHSLRFLLSGWRKNVRRKKKIRHFVQEETLCILWNIPTNRYFQQWVRFRVVLNQNEMREREGKKKKKKR